MRLRCETLTAQDPSERPIKSGDLKKTTKSRKNNATIGSTRERHFQLTRVAIEYLERFSQVKVRRSFPLTSVERVEDDKDNTQVFRLVFKNTIMVLEASSPKDATEWVQSIRDGELPGPAVRAQWHATPTPTDSLLRTCTEAEHEEELTERASDAETTVEDPPEDTLKYKYSWRQSRRLQQQHPHPERLLSNKHIENKAYEKLHNEYAMIKYPHTKWSIPREKIIRIDKDNLHIMWKQSGLSDFHMSNTLPLHLVWEIREGQRTKWFDHFPYEEVKDQSFSLIFEEENYGGRYARLSSLDLICDNPVNYKEWIEGLRALFPSPHQSPSTDPSILWLKRLWTTKHDNHELSETATMKLLSTIHPSYDVGQAKKFIRIAHQHQSTETTHYGYALRWEGFIVLFNLMCENGRLLEMFKSYTKAYPTLGLTMEEFGDFLIEECSWRRGDCTEATLKRMVRHHDHRHESFKKYAAAKNLPSEFNTAKTKPLLTYAGFLSFLRSSDNAASEKEEKLEDDMDQPLSHYFINSSHNTYLEGHQLNGKSSCEAYIRALLQGCRCIEIDCWDGVLGEAILVYHGHTFTTRLDFTKVIRTIKDYAFLKSSYPVIISIENHCSSSNQKWMAKRFLKIMGDVLCKENLVEAERRERLPTPTELKNKIILKGTFKKEVKAAMETSIETSLPAYLVKSISTDEQLTSDENQDMVAVYGPDARKMVAQDDQETTFVDDSEKDLEKLVVYCRSISIKPWSWSKQRETSVSEMFSFGEPSAMKLCIDNPQEMLACTERQLVRTYPKGTRFDSSNYDPTLMWGCGMHMVALNFQTPDVWMHLNQGFFRQNGGCGYVLKPEVMRGSSQSSVKYSPSMTEPHPDIPTVDLEIEVLISGQQLCPYKKKCVSLTVDIQTFGIPADTSAMSQASYGSAFWPQWERGKFVYSRRKILMPELCLVYFRVEVQYSTGNPQLFGQNCIQLLSLKPGECSVGVLVTSVGVLVTSVGVPVTSVGVLVTSVGVPVTSVGVLVTSVGVLVTSVGVPVTSVGVPVTSVGVPVTSVGVPVTSVGVPVTSVGVPVTSVGVLVTSVGVPVTSVGVLVPVTSVGVLVTSVGVPVTSVGVPVTSVGVLVTSVGVLVTSVSVLASLIQNPFQHFQVLIFSYNRRLVAEILVPDLELSGTNLIFPSDTTTITTVKCCLQLKPYTSLAVVYPHHVVVMWLDMWESSLFKSLLVGEITLKGKQLMCSGMAS
eukprot:Em0020g31a